MRAFGFLLGGLLVWAADFFLLYSIASIFLTTPIARVLAGIVTVAALAVDAWLIWRSSQRLRTVTNGYAKWLARMSQLTASLSAVAVLWQGFPAIFI